MIWKAKGERVQRFLDIVLKIGDYNPVRLISLHIIFNLDETSVRKKKKYLRQPHHGGFKNLKDLRLRKANIGNFFEFIQTIRDPFCCLMWKERE